MPMRLLLAAVLAATPVVTAPPPALRVDPFYAKYVPAAGMPVLGSAKVSDAALLAAAGIVEGMFAHRPDLAANLRVRGYRFAVMARSEGTVDLPEQRGWKRPARDDPRLTRCERIHYDTRIGAMTDAQYWNARARGMGGQLTSGAEEDLLGERASRYWGETIFVHEVAHGVLDAIRVVDPALFASIDHAYRDTRAAGRWTNEYAATRVDEYWAVGTQIWFESSRRIMVDGRQILSPDDLRAYDPALHAALARVYGTTHRLAGDPFHRHPARVPPGPPPVNTAEVC